MNRIGIIGLGRMGSAMARRFATEGYDVHGWTRSGRAVEDIESVKDIAALVAVSDTLILSLLDGAAVASVLDQLLDCDLASKHIIDTSTVIPDILKTRNEAIAAKGATAVDAPISGGPELVLAGSCGIFIGGTEDAAERAQATLAAISNRVFHVGPLGAGLVMKVINNGMIQAYFAGLNDMMPLAKRAGLPMETAMRILSSGPAGMPMIADRLPKILGEDQSVGFAMSAVAKDNDVFLRVVRSFGLDAPILEIAGKQQRAVVAAGHADADPAVMVPFAYDNG
ncbi:NAD(P)-dependent oxidoreductase [Cognatiyoonia sp. IB215446]|uniref:NAD(P)-dependent oxidoreductase n=1 Tax=Cognatiyoonia sp. IB215446 TaxID=3097355 RepID=UPI002A136247|nr:NAD(P)-dependent oxidoreductase [Cognatiyoonia sp. IB215446]MDX8347231.1 NAD(P)-dependent oxidoreductase [Cognatiyoonia sp. IB215446]